jgi:hypothetical protein
MTPSRVSGLLRRLSPSGEAANARSGPARYITSRKVRLRRPARSQLIGPALRHESGVGVP